jgi:hypothetical protein
MLGTSVFSHQFHHFHPSPFARATPCHVEQRPRKEFDLGNNGGGQWQEVHDYLKSLCGDVHITRGEYDDDSRYPETKQLTIGTFKLGICHGHQVCHYISLLDPVTSPSCRCLMNNGMIKPLPILLGKALSELGDTPNGTHLASNPA